MVENPKVSVLMPVYNGEKYLREAIDSILRQTFRDFEFIIINDGSTDTSDEIIRSYSDQRICYICNTTNLGLSPTLNKGLSLARGEYIARMDCDDLSHPERLEKLVQFLDSHDEYGLVGSLFALINEKREITEIGGAKLLEDEDMNLGLLLGNVYCHGETMFRKELITKYNFFYNAAYNPCEDYDLWTRMSEVTKLKDLPEVLYFYMVNPAGMTGTRFEEMQNCVQRIAHEMQRKHPFPSISLAFLKRRYLNGKKYRDTYLDVNGKQTLAYLQLMY